MKNCHYIVLYSFIFSVMIQCSVKQERDLIFPAIRKKPPVAVDTTFEFKGTLNGAFFEMNGIVKDRDLFFYNDSLEATIRLAKLDTSLVTMTDNPRSAYARIFVGQTEYTTRSRPGSGTLHIQSIDTAANVLHGTLELKAVNTSTDEVLRIENGRLEGLPVLHLTFELNGRKISMDPKQVSQSSTGFSVMALAGNNKLMMHIPALVPGVYQTGKGALSYSEHDVYYEVESALIVLNDYYPGKLVSGTFEFSGYNTADSTQRIEAVKGSFAY